MTDLYIVGIGPGKKSGMTFEANAAISRADIIVGYTKYIELVLPHYPEKEFFSTPMLGEAERCQRALELCAAGKTVAIVCSGDSGVYGMASLVYELSEGHSEVNIIPVAGVSAAMSGAALLGAPLSHDFAVISLSDLLTPWEMIEKRLLLAAEAELIICLYNPSSHKRHDYLEKAVSLLLTRLPPETVCGMAKNIGRDGEECSILTLIELKNAKADMFTTVFIGSTQTRIIRGKMVTPRGYKNV